jgi:predicted acylesterase/phospholipase RssA
MSKNIGGKQIGLVLAGGGGKGAYQIGCWRAFQRLGIRFSAVAGSSVGALNAALIAEGNLRKATELWSNISREKVFKTRATNVLSLMIRLLFIPGLIYFQMASWQRFKVRLRKSAVGILTYALSTFIAIFLIIWIVSLLDPAKVYNTDIQWYGESLVKGLVFIGLPLWAIWNLPVLGWFISERLNLFALDSTPLKDTISTTLEIELVSKSEVATFVTIAKPIEVFDPLSPTYEIIPGHNTPLSTKVTRLPSFVKKYLPTYVLLNGKTPDEITDLLLRSSSLPFGLFSNKSPIDAGWIDGGLADNVPIQPLIDHGCELIIVVNLDRRRKNSAWAKNKIYKYRMLKKLEKESVDYLNRFTKRYGKSISTGVADPQEYLNPQIDTFRDFPDILNERVDDERSQDTRPLPNIIHMIPSNRLLKK